MERLSSGLRINSAKDDAAGQAIANRMTSQINGLSQAQRNANDGISVAQTAEGALNQVNENLQRIRELTVQSQNGINSAMDLASIQAEINQCLDEIDRISTQTDFNGVKVLASDQNLSVQVGANDGEVIDVNLQKIDRSSLNLNGFSVQGGNVQQIIQGSLSEVTPSSSAIEQAFGSDITTVTINGEDFEDVVSGNYSVLFGVDTTSIDLRFFTDEANSWFVRLGARLADSNDMPSMVARGFENYQSGNIYADSYIAVDFDMAEYTTPGTVNFTIDPNSFF